MIDPNDWYIRGRGLVHRTPTAADPGGGEGGGSTAFSGARMVGTVNSGGTGATIALPSNTGSFEFDQDTVVAVSYDTDGYTTGHGLADGRFLIPADGWYRITVVPGFQYFTPSAFTALFHAYIAIDGDHGFPSVGSPRRVWATHRSPLRADDSQTELWTPTLTMAEEFTAGELVSFYGRFDSVPSDVGETGFGGIISFEIERLTGASPIWRGIIQDATAFAASIAASTETDGDLDNGVSWDTDGFNASDGTWVIPAGMGGLYRFLATETFFFTGACADYADFGFRLYINAQIWGVDNKGQLWSDNNNVTFHIFAQTAILVPGDVIKVTFEHTNCDTVSGPGSGVSSSPFYVMEYLGPEPT